jgi:hypothetical protein
MKARLARTARVKAAPSAKRRFRGVTYDSITERDRAEWLWVLREQGTILWVIRQPMFDLCAGITYRPDFLVCERMADGLVDIYCEDVKGRQDADFRRNMRLWAQYEVPFELRVIMRSGKTGWTIDQVVAGHGE